jgi:hypothetical protein
LQTDDVNIGSESFDFYLKYTEEVLDRLKAVSLTASITKSEFMMKSLNVLRDCLKNGVVKLSQRHIEKVLQI